MVVKARPRASTEPRQRWCCSRFRSQWQLLGLWCYVVVRASTCQRRAFIAAFSRATASLLLSQQARAKYGKTARCTCTPNTGCARGDEGLASDAGCLLHGTGSTYFKTFPRQLAAPQVPLRMRHFQDAVCIAMSYLCVCVCGEVK